MWVIPKQLPTHWDLCYAVLNIEGISAPGLNILHCGGLINCDAHEHRGKLDSYVDVNLSMLVGGNP